MQSACDKDAIRCQSVIQSVSCQLVTQLINQSINQSINQNSFRYHKKKHHRLSPSRTSPTKYINVYYINTSGIPSELSGENYISSHVKITCYLHTLRHHRRYGYIITRAFFTGVYIINRILHARLWI